MQELFDDKIHFFKFFSIVYLNLFIRTRKGKYPVLRTYTKSHELIKHTKISNSANFRTWPTEMVLTELPLRNSK